MTTTNPNIAGSAVGYSPVCAAPVEITAPVAKPYCPCTR